MSSDSPTTGGRLGAARTLRRVIPSMRTSKQPIIADLSQLDICNRDVNQKFQLFLFLGLGSRFSAGKRLSEVHIDRDSIPGERDGDIVSTKGCCDASQALPHNRSHRSERNH